MTKKIIGFLTFIFLFIYMYRMSGIIYNTYIADYYLDKLSNEINFSEARKNNPEFVFLNQMVKKY